MAKRRVVLTGASGYVAQRMFTELAERWDLVPIDVRATTRDGKAGARHHRRGSHQPRPQRVPAALQGRRRRHPLRLRQRAEARRHDLAGQQRRRSSGPSTRTSRSPTTCTGRRSRRVCAASWCAAPTTPPTTTSGSSGRARWRWSRPTCRRGRTTGTAGPRRPTSCLGFVFATGQVGGARAGSRPVAHRRAARRRRPRPGQAGRHSR